MDRDIEDVERNAKTCLQNAYNALQQYRREQARPRRKKAIKQERGLKRFLIGLKTFFDDTLGYPAYKEVPKNKAALAFQEYAELSAKIARNDYLELADRFEKKGDRERARMYDEKAATLERDFSGFRNQIWERSPWYNNPERRRTMAVSTSVISLIGGLFLIINSLNSGVLGSPGEEVLNWNLYIGIILIIIGLIFGYFWIRGKGKN